MRTYDDLLDEATSRLDEAGLMNPARDASVLANHVLGPGARRGAHVPANQAQAFRRLVDRRCAREPLRYITGHAPLGGLEFRVGPGVFVPREQSEPVLEWALRAIADVERPCIVDLCTGSGAMALALCHMRPDARVTGIDIDPGALAWAHDNARERRRAGDPPISLVCGDISSPDVLPDCMGTVDLVVCNPPYMPPGYHLPPETGRFHPAVSIFAAEEGLSVIRAAIDCATRLLRPSGRFAVEHDEPQAASVAELFARADGFSEVTTHPGPDGRPKFTTGTKKGDLGGHPESDGRALGP